MKRKKGRDREDLYLEGSFYYFRKRARVISWLQFGSLTEWLTDWSTVWLSHWLIGWLSHSLADSLINWLTHSLTVVWLTRWTTDWLADWLTDSVTNKLTTTQTRPLTNKLTNYITDLHNKLQPLCSSKFHSVLGNPTVHHRDHNSLKFVAVLSHLNPLHVHFKTILHSTPTSSQQSLFFRLQDRTYPVRRALLPHTRYMPCLSLSSSHLAQTAKSRFL